MHQFYDSHSRYVLQYVTIHISIITASVPVCFLCVVRSFSSAVPPLKEMFSLGVTFTWLKEKENEKTNNNALLLLSHSGLRRATRRLLTSV